MTPLFQKIILFSIIPVLTIIIGGSIAIYKKPNGNIRSVILHFAAGVVFSVVAVEILPDVVKQYQPVHTIIGFLLGVVAMLAIKHLAEGKGNNISEKIISKGMPFSLLLGVGVDIFIDGLLLGIGFSAGIKEGLLLSVALSIELLSLGMAISTELKNKNINNSKIFFIVVGFASLFFVSAVLGATLLHSLSESALDIVLSFGLAALLFLVTEELLTEAHEEKETIWHTSSFFIGFLLFLILGIIF